MNNLSDEEVASRIFHDPKNVYFQLHNLVKWARVSAEEALADLRSGLLKAHRYEDGFVAVRGDNAVAWLETKKEALARIALHGARSRGEVQARAITRKRPRLIANIPSEFWDSMSLEQVIDCEERGYLDAADCRRLWKILKRPDRPPPRMWVEYAMDDLRREFPLSPVGHA